MASVTKTLVAESDATAKKTDHQMLADAIRRGVDILADEEVFKQVPTGLQEKVLTDPALLGLIGRYGVENGCRIRTEPDAPGCYGRRIACHLQTQRALLQRLDNDAKTTPIPEIVARLEQGDYA